MIKKHAGWVLIVVTVLLVLMALCQTRTALWRPPSQDLRTGRQDNPPGGGSVLTGVRGCFVEGRVAPQCAQGTPRPPQCRNEDGNPNGWPCLWTDPDTGDLYFVSSREYWD